MMALFKSRRMPITIFALYVPLQAKPGKEKEVADFLRSAVSLVNAEPGTIAWFAIQEGPLSLRKIVFGSGIGKPMIATGNSLSADTGSVMARSWSSKWGLWAALHSEGTVVERNSPRHRNRRSCTATTRG
jgi:hypothetical protein